MITSTMLFYLMHNSMLQLYNLVLCLFVGRWTQLRLKVLGKYGSTFLVAYQEPAPLREA